jgi:hypothetical protein
MKTSEFVRQFAPPVEREGVKFRRDRWFESANVIDLWLMRTAEEVARMERLRLSSGLAWPPRAGACAQGGKIVVIGEGGDSAAKR